MLVSRRCSRFRRKQGDTADGWKGFFQTVDLFGTKELSNQYIMQYVYSLFSAIEDCAIESSGFSREELLYSIQSDTTNFASNPLISSRRQTN